MVGRYKPILGLSKDTTTVPKINEFSSSVDKDYYINQIVKIVNYQLVGKEKLNGKNTYHIIGSISPDVSFVASEVNPITDLINSVASTWALAFK